MLSSAVIVLIHALTVLAKDTVACSTACQSPLSELRFDGSPVSADYYSLTCTNTLLVQSTFLCMRHYCSQKEVADGIISLDTTCEIYGATRILPWSIISNITDLQLLEFPHIGYADLHGPITYSTPVYISGSLFMASLKTEVVWDDSLTTRANYGYALFGFFGIVIIIGIGCRITNFFSLCSKNNRPGICRGILRAIRATLKTRILLPALISSQTAEPGVCGLIPPRLESLTILAFLAINVILCCISYEPFNGNLFWLSTNSQIWRYVSDRTGVLSMSNLPLIWAFSMRNNVLMWATGWSFATFNSFHRWVARVATIEAIIHSVGYTVFSFLDGGKEEYIGSWMEQYWWMGATISMSLLCVFSIYQIRQHTYELFLALHIGLAVLFLVSMWYHVKIFAGQYNVFIWPCVAVWSFDRIIRLGRLALLNFLDLKGTATYNQEADIVRVQLPTRRIFHHRPGSYYYLYLFHGNRQWESHPFTLSAWKDVTADGTGQKRELSFVFRPRGGFTSQFRDYLLQQTVMTNHSASTVSVRAAIEGPYGTPYSISTCSSILFIVGGSGITVALSHLQSLWEIILQTRESGGQMRLNSIRLVWAVRSAALFDDINRHDLSRYFELASQSDHPHFRTDIHITGSGDTRIPPNSTQDVREIDLESVSQHSSGHIRLGEKGLKGLGKSTDIEKWMCQPIVSPASNLHKHNCRPVVYDLILDCAEEWQASRDGMAVVSSGPGKMMDDARSATVAAIGRGYDKIEFYPEMFHW